MLLVIGITFAWFTWNSTTNTDVSVTIEGINITYEDGQDITGINLIPVSSKEKGEADGTAIAKEITVSSNMNAYLDLNMSLDILPDGLKDASFKWEFYKGADLLLSGNFSTSNQSDVINLLSKELVTSTETTYKLYIWIDGNMSNPNTMQNQTFKFMLNATASDNVSSEAGEAPLDDSGANRPKLAENMIPIMYDTNTSSWVKASTTDKESQYKWYDYDNKQWANAVLVSETNRDTYLSAEAGTAIPEDDILTYYVWIPRYKYKVFNITKTIGTDSYNAQNTGIDIVFENEIETTGEITCNDYDFSITNGSLSETCSGSNGEYYTHPAFTFGDKELTGIWVGKFEVSNSTSEIRIKPNASSLRNVASTEFYSAIKDMPKESNVYGLSTDTNVVDSHMMKNMEWGVVAYLTHSDYGRCNGSSCTEIGINNNSNYTTGCGAAPGSSSSSICNAYNTDAGMQASTTGNIYGIYDMSGGAFEYVMGNMSSSSGSYAYYASSGGSNFSYSTSTAKYIDTYANGSTYNDQTAYNRARLGDATGEVAVGGIVGWYNDSANFVYSSYSWFQRGGYYSNGTNAGVFFFHNNNGNRGTYISARGVVLAL